MAYSKSLSEKVVGEDKSSEKIDQNPVGYYTLIASVIVMAAISYQFGQMGEVWSEFLKFLTGGVEQLQTGIGGLHELIPVLFGIVAVELVIMFAVVLPLMRVFGLKRKGSHAVSELLKNMTHGYHFTFFFQGVFLEELFARWFFLGLLTMIPFFQGAFWFYTFMIIGNLIWAVIHLSNFKSQVDQNPLFTIPQFVGGVFLTFVFAKYGFFAAVIAHFIYNAVAFASHKKERVNHIDLYRFLVAGGYAIVGFLLLSQPIQDILVWFTSTEFQALEGWGWVDYIGLTLLVMGVLYMVLDLLLFDNANLGPHTSFVWKEGPVVGVFAVIVWLAVAYAAFWLLTWFGVSSAFAILLISILFAFGSKSYSGSATSRVFFATVPTVFLFIAVVHALGFWGGLGFLALYSVIELPDSLLSYVDS